MLSVLLRTMPRLVNVIQDTILQQLQMMDAVSFTTHKLPLNSILIHICNFQLDVLKTPIVQMAKHVQTTAAHVARTLIVELQNHARMANAKKLHVTI